MRHEQQAEIVQPDSSENTSGLGQHQVTIENERGLNSAHTVAMPFKRISSLGMSAGLNIKSS